MCISFNFNNAHSVCSCCAILSVDWHVASFGALHIYTETRHSPGYAECVCVLWCDESCREYKPEIDKLKRSHFSQMCEIIQAARYCWHSLHPSHIQDSIHTDTRIVASDALTHGRDSNSNCSLSSTIKQSTRDTINLLASRALKMLY